MRGRFCFNTLHIRRFYFCWHWRPWVGIDSKHLWNNLLAKTREQTNIKNLASGICRAGGTGSGKFQYEERYLRESVRFVRTFVVWDYVWCEIMVDRRGNFLWWKDPPLFRSPVYVGHSKLISWVLKGMQVYCRKITELCRSSHVNGTNGKAGTLTTGGFIIQQSCHTVGRVMTYVGFNVYIG